MKIKNFLSIVFSFLLIGCSANYSLKNFPSGEKFYEDFNHFAKNKNLKVMLNNDSTFKINNGAVIENDILYSSIRGEDSTYNSTVALNAIKEINYTGVDYKSANILVKNGEWLKTKIIQLIKDSVEFTVISETYLKTKIASVDKIKEVNFRNRWTGTVSGFFFGIYTGIVTGLSIALFYGYAILLGKATPDNYPTAIFISPAAGIVIGTLAGWLIGNNWTYHFN